MKARPPRLASRLLEWRWPGDVGAYLLGDLEERFHALAGRSLLRARLWYWRQALAALVVPVAPTGQAGGLATDPGRALRQLLRRPGAAVTAVVTLGLGIGVVGTAFSILWGTVLQGLPFDEAGRLVHFERASLAEGRNSLAVTPHDYLEWREAQTSFVDLGAFVEATALAANPGAPPERFVGVQISANSFPLLRVQPALGRGFGVADEEPGAPRVVILSHRLWNSRYGADPALIGADIVLNGEPTTVVGVMPDGFGFPIAEHFWFPLRIDLSALERGSGRLDVFGRLSDGATLEGARAEFDAITAGLASAHPATNDGISAVLRSFTEEYVGPDFVQTVYRLLLGAVLVLLICCVNVANLLLIQGVHRRRELAVRISLGATQAHLIRQLMAEVSVMAGLGAAIGLGLVAYGVGWFNRVGTQAGVFDLPHGSDSLFWWQVGLDAPTLIAVAGAAGFAALLAGTIPALRTSRVSVLLRGGRGGGAMDAGSRLSGGLVTAQLALTGALTVAAAFVAQSVVNISTMRAGIDAEGVVTTRVDLPQTAVGSGAGYTDHDSRLRFAEALLESFEANPSVAAAAIATDLPLDPPLAVRFEIEGRADDEERDVGVVNVSPSYFGVFGLSASEGRLFESTDRASSVPVALVNETFVRLYLEDRPAVGVRVRIGGPDADEPWVRVVGVVPDLWERPGSPQREAGLYLPLAQSGMADASLRLGYLGLRYQTVALRMRAGGADPWDVVRATVFGQDSSVPVRELRTLDEVLAQQTGRYRVWGRFYLAFAVAGLLLVAIGIYGVLSFNVAMRTSEIGVRRALGASGESVRRQVLAPAMRPLGIGTALGLTLGAAGLSGITRVLYGVESDNPWLYVGAATLLIGVGLAASWIPALRATRIDPLEAIRHE